MIWTVLRDAAHLVALFALGVLTFWTFLEIPYQQGKKRIRPLLISVCLLCSWLVLLYEWILVR